MSLAPRLAQQWGEVTALVQSEFDAAVGNHARHYLALVAKQGPWLLGDARGQGKRQLQAVRQLQVELGNLIQTAMTLRQQADWQRLLVLVEPLWQLLNMTSEFALLAETAAGLLAYADVPEATLLKTTLQLCLAHVRHRLGNLEAAAQLLAATETAQDLPPWLAGQRLRHQAQFLSLRGKLDEATAVLEQALAEGEAAQDPLLCSLALNALGLIAQGQDDLPRSRELLLQATELHTASGNLYVQSMCLVNLAFIEKRLGTRAAARELLSQAAEIKEKLGDRCGFSDCLDNLGTIYQAEGRIKQAQELITQALEIKHEIGHLEGQAVALANLAELAAIKREWLQALKFLAEAINLRQPHCLGTSFRLLEHLRRAACAACYAGDYRAGAEFLKQAFSQRNMAYEEGELQMCLALTVFLLHVKGQHDVASTLDGALTARQGHRQTTFDNDVKELVSQVLVSGNHPEDLTQTEDDIPELANRAWAALNAATS